MEFLPAAWHMVSRAWFTPRTPVTQKQLKLLRFRFMEVDFSHMGNVSCASGLGQAFVFVFHLPRLQSHIAPLDAHPRLHEPDEEFFEFIDEPRSAFTDALYDQIVGEYMSAGGVNRLQWPRVHTQVAVA